MDAETDVYEHLPEEVVRKLLTFLFLDGFLKVSILTILHDDADGLLRDKRVVITDDKVTVDLGHDLYLLHSFEGRLLRKHAHVDFLDDVSLVFDKLPRLV